MSYIRAVSMTSGRNSWQLSPRFRAETQQKNWFPYQRHYCLKRQRNQKLHHWKKRDKSGHYERYVQAWNRLQNLTKPQYQNFDLGLANECKSNPNKFWNWFPSKDHARRCVKHLTINDGREVIELQPETINLTKQILHFHLHSRNR